MYTYNFFKKLKIKRKRKKKKSKNHSSQTSLLPKEVQKTASRFTSNLNPSPPLYPPRHVEMRERAGRKRINDGSLPDITKMKKQTRFKMFHDGLYALKA